MKSVNIAELKNRLSAYLNEVKAGEEILVRDRRVPVARILPFRPEDHDTERLKLAAEGKLRLGNGKPVGASFWAMRAPKLTTEDIRRVINEDRGGKT